IDARRGETLPDLNARVQVQVQHMLTNQTPYVIVPETGTLNQRTESDISRDPADGDEDAGRKRNT
ncbi:MAG TPA: hypothetical protein VK095_05225, partial [Beutenbergiaceae bacterium]|nr:hypothetical protein [Beutenbergiaceae bacterium]